MFARHQISAQRRRVGVTAGIVVLVCLALLAAEGITELMDGVWIRSSPFQLTLHVAGIAWTLFLLIRMAWSRDR
jgi:Zn-dependent protease with chaperone function